MSSVPVTREEAEQITQEVRARLEEVIDLQGEVIELLEKAYALEVHVQLGYETFAAYVEDQFADTAARVDSTVRRNLAPRLRGLGLGVRTVAVVLSVHPSTVSRDLQGTSVDASATPATIGRDGKRYPRGRRTGSASRQPRNILYARAVRSVERAIDRLEAMHRDENFLRLQEHLRGFSRSLDTAAQRVASLAEELRAEFIRDAAAGHSEVPPHPRWSPEMVAEIDQTMADLAQLQEELDAGLPPHRRTHRQAES